MIIQKEKQLGKIWNCNWTFNSKHIIKEWFKIRNWILNNNNKLMNINNEIKLLEPFFLQKDAQGERTAADWTN